MNPLAIRTFISACVFACKCDDTQCGRFMTHAGSRLVFKWIIGDYMTYSLCLLRVMSPSHWHGNVTDHHVFGVCDFDLRYSAYVS